MANKKPKEKIKQKGSSPNSSKIKRLLKEIKGAVKQLRVKRDDQKSILKKLKLKNKKKADQKVIEKKIVKWKKKERGLKERLRQLEKEHEASKKGAKSKSEKREKKKGAKSNSKKVTAPKVVNQVVAKEDQKLSQSSKSTNIEKRNSTGFLAREAISRLRRISDLKVLNQFTSGEKRVTVINAAKSRANALNRLQKKKLQ